MGKTRAYKHRLDKYYHLARQTGYRSRAAFKLIQLNQQFSFLNTAHVCIDLCAAPGGWSQVAAKYMPVGSHIIAIDLAPIRDIPRVVALQGDILLPKTHARVKKLIQGQKADVILNDGAPNVGAAWVTDSSNQLELCLASVRFATLFSRKGGSFVTKVFRSEHYNSLLWVLGQLWDKVIPTKPKASRDSSAELFIVALGYKAPDHVDQRLLDPSYVFTDLDDLMKTHSASTEVETKMSSIDFSTVSVADFLRIHKPIDVLNSANKLSFDDDIISQAAKNHPATTKEIKLLCEDLKVVGFSDRKYILRWRNKLRSALVIGEANEEKDDIEAEESNEEEDEDIKTALSELKTKKRKEEKAQRNKLAKMRDQLLKRFQKNLGGPNSEIADPKLRYGKIETPTIIEDITRSYQELVEENLEKFHEEQVSSKKEGQEEEFIGPTPKFARHVEIDEDKIVVDDETKSKESRIWYNQDIFGDSSMDEDEDVEDYLEGEEYDDESNDDAHAKEKGGEGAANEAEAHDTAEKVEVANQALERLKGQSRKEFDSTAFSLAKQVSTKKGKLELVNQSFNRFNHGDTDLAPKWFAEDEGKFNRPMLPISKEDVAQFRQMQKEINEGDTKRVLEARARKKAKLYQKMKTAQEKVDTIAEKEGLNEKSKLRLMEKITQKALNQSKPAPTIVVSHQRDDGKPSIPKRAKGSRLVFVDSRTKKDLRGQKNADSRPKGVNHKKKSKYIHRRK